MIFDYSLADNTVAFVFNGPMDAKTINGLRDQILAKMEVHEKVNIYLEDQGIEFFTLYSVLQGIIFPLQHHKRFNKVAMVTNRSWIHLIASLNSTIISAEVRNYVTEDRLDAMSWMTAYEVDVFNDTNYKTKERAYELAPVAFSDHTVAYIIEGDMTKKAIKELRSIVLEKFTQHDKINLYLEDRRIEHFSLSAATIGALFPLEYAKRFHKIALVTDRKWIHVLAAIDNVLIKPKLSHFKREERYKAMAFIND